MLAWSFGAELRARLLLSYRSTSAWLWRRSLAPGLALHRLWRHLNLDDRPSQLRNLRVQVLCPTRDPGVFRGALLIARVPVAILGVGVGPAQVPVVVGVDVPLRFIGGVLAGAKLQRRRRTRVKVG